MLYDAMSEQAYYRLVSCLRLLRGSQNSRRVNDKINNVAYCVLLCICKRTPALK